MINSNQEEFLRMINEPAPQGGDMAAIAAQLAGGAGAGGMANTVILCLLLTVMLLWSLLHLV